ncbi:MAG: WD40 repeat domain-containing protein [Planctomycetes bacterium]|nr:WD40 repeat domain-containing protein [Planctomycetota bacterium]
MIHRHFFPIVMTALWTAAIFASGSSLAHARQIGAASAVPDKAALDEAQRLIREVFQKEFDGAKTSAEKTELAKKMLGQAKDSVDDPAHHFVLLRVAREVAVQAGNAEVAMEAVDQMALAFQVDASAIRVECLEGVSKSARLSGQFRALARQAVPLIDQAVATDDYAAAERLGKLAVAAAQKAREYTMGKQLSVKMEAVAEAKNAFDEIQESLDKLDQSPVDPDANLAVGRFYCLAKGDWEKGVAMLALGSDPALSSLAIRELEEVASTDAQISLGDGWWDLAETQEGRPRDCFLLRAGHWYEQAQAEATSGLAKVRLEKRLGQIAKIRPPGTHVAGGAPRPTKRSGGGKTVAAFDPTAVEPLGTLQGHTNSIRGLVFSPDGSVLVSGSGDRTVKFWNMATGQLRSALPQFQERVEHLALSPDGQVLAIVGTGPNLSLWNTLRGQPQGVLAAHVGQTTAVAFAPDGSQLATCGTDQMVKLWEIPSGKLVHTMHGHSGEVKSIAVSPDSKIVASASTDRTVVLWDVSSGGNLATLQGHVASVESVAFSPDGSLLASGGQVPEVFLWDVATRERRHQLQGHASNVAALAFHPSGSPLATGSGNGEIKFWDPKTGQLQGTIQNDTNVSSLAFSPDGSVLASGGRRTLNLWRSNPAKKPATPKPEASTTPRETETLASADSSETPARRRRARGSRVGTRRGAQDWILLPPLVDVERDCRDASWKWDGEIAEFGAEKPRANVTFPLNILGSYELQARVTIVQAKETTAIHLPIVGDKGVILDMRGDSGNSGSATATIGIRGVNPPATGLGQVSMQVGTEYAIACKVMVLPNSVALEIRRDNQVLLQWTGTALRVSRTRAIVPGTVGLETAYYTTSRFRDLQLRMLSGQATPLFPDSATAPER